MAHSEGGARRAPWPTIADGAALVLAALALGLAAAYFGLRAAGPFDGARLRLQEPFWRPDGVVVARPAPGPPGLREGDRVVAVEGRSLEAWAKDLFSPGAPHPRWRVGQTVTYTVVRDGHPLDVAIVLVPYPIGRVAQEELGLVLALLGSFLVGAFVYACRPGDPTARSLLLAGAAIAGAVTFTFGLQISDFVDGVGFWLLHASALGAYVLAWGANLHFALLFPRPGPLVARHPRLAGLAYVGAWGLFAAGLAASSLAAPTTLAWLGAWVRALWAMTIVYLGLTLAAIVATYRASRDPTTRRKIRLVVAAIVLVEVGAGALYFLPGVALGRPLVSSQLLGALTLPLPASLAVAILRNRLFDIDLIIRRTLVYGVLTAALVLTYWASVVALQGILRALAGQTSDVAVVGSTLLIAVLFQPLRRRIQGAVDRRFYRRRYDAAKVLAAFGAAARDEVDLGRLTGTLLAAVEETMRPAHASLWLRPSDQGGGTPRAAHPRRGGLMAR
jgi:two-component system, NarL family, sensor kinase